MNINEKRWVDDGQQQGDLRTVKVSRKVREAFAFYCRYATTFGVQERTLIVPDDLIKGCTALEAFSARDSMGSYLATREPALLRRVLHAKAQVNQQIEMWAEGVAEWTLFMHELREDKAFKWFPEWVWAAVEQQAKKIRYGKA